MVIKRILKFITTTALIVSVVATPVFADDIQVIVDNNPHTANVRVSLNVEDISGDYKAIIESTLSNIDWDISIDYAENNVATAEEKTQVKKGDDCIIKLQVKPLGTGLPSSDVLVNQMEKIYENKIPLDLSLSVQLAKDGVPTSSERPVEEVPAPLSISIPAPEYNQVSQKLQYCILREHKGVIDDITAGSSYNPDKNTITFNTDKFSQYDLMYSIEDKVTYTIEFRDYDGKILNNKTVFYEDEPVTVPANPIREGYEFIGWNVIPQAVATRNEVYVAQYKEKALNTYLVRFIDYDGRIISSTEYAENDSVDVPIYPTRYGYTFTGWDKPISYKAVADIDYIAQYVSDGSVKNKYVITFRDYDGRIISSTRYEENENIVVPAPPTRDGYTFYCWSPFLNNKAIDHKIYTAVYTKDKSEDIVEDAEDNHTYENTDKESDSSSNNGNANDPTANIYTITYHNVGMTSSVQVKHGSVIPQPNVSFPNYEFIGWWYQQGVAWLKWDFNQPITQALELWAMYQKVGTVSDLIKPVSVGNNSVPKEDDRVVVSSGTKEEPKEKINPEEEKSEKEPIEVEIPTIDSVNEAPDPTTLTDKDNDISRAEKDRIKREEAIRKQLESNGVTVKKDENTNINNNPTAEEKQLSDELTPPADANTNIDTPTTGVNPIIWTVLAVLVVLLILLSIFLFIKKKKAKKADEEEQDKEFEDLY